MLFPCNTHPTRVLYSLLVSKSQVILPLYFAQEGLTIATETYRYSSSEDLERSKTTALFPLGSSARSEFAALYCIGVYWVAAQPRWTARHHTHKPQATRWSSCGAAVRHRRRRRSLRWIIRSWSRYALSCWTFYGEDVEKYFRRVSYPSSFPYFFFHSLMGAFFFCTVAIFNALLGRDVLW